MSGATLTLKAESNRYGLRYAEVKIAVGDISIPSIEIRQQAALPSIVIASNQAGGLLTTLEVPASPEAGETYVEANFSYGHMCIRTLNGDLPSQRGYRT